MPNESAVDRAQMATAAQQIQDAVDKINSLQSQMNTNHADVRAGWDGDAANAFTSTYEHFAADFAKVVNALQNMQEKLAGTRSRYEATEQSTTSAVGRVSNLLNG